jgi:hypothetical protein
LQQNSPAIGRAELARSQVGAVAGSPLIHTPYYHYYYSYLIKYMWRKGLYSSTKSLFL